MNKSIEILVAASVVAADEEISIANRATSRASKNKTTIESIVVESKPESISNTDALDSTSDIVEKKTMLLQYIGSLAKAPAQKSKEWYAIKATTIGGSEVATVLGLNPYRTRTALIAEKLNMCRKFYGNLYTRWGNLFEHITKNYTEVVFGIDEIHETGSIPGVIERQRYSPDGLGIVRLLCADDTYDYFVVLFEFKSPFSSIPNNTIPSHYMPQVQTGLLSIPIADIGIFVNNCYRKCALQDLTFNDTYDFKFHKSDFKKKKSALDGESTLACGIIGFYQTIDHYEKFLDENGYADPSDSDEDLDDTSNHFYYQHTAISATTAFSKLSDTGYTMNGNDTGGTKYFTDVDLEILKASKDAPIDFGESSVEILSRLLELYEEKRVHAVYYPIIINDSAVNQLDVIQTHNLQQNNSVNNPNKLGRIYKQRFINHCNEKNLAPVGYLPWKLMKSDIIVTDRDDNWLEKIKGPVESILTEIDEIAKSPDPNAAYESRYGTKKTECSDVDIDAMRSISKNKGTSDKIHC